MSNVIIKNDFLTVEIETMGAQIKSVKNNSNLNLLWSGDEYIWKDRAPVLFPICGKLKDDKYIINSKEYTLSAHGYACSKEFEIESSDNTSVTFLHKSDEKTKQWITDTLSSFKENTIEKMIEKIENKFQIKMKQELYYYIVEIFNLNIEMLKKIANSYGKESSKNEVPKNIRTI